MANTIRTTIRQMLRGAGGGGGGDTPVVNPAVKSVEVVSVETADMPGTTVTVNLTKGQDVAQCVPMSTQGTTAFPTDDTEHMITTVEVIDNAGTPAVQLTRYTSGHDLMAYTIYVVEFHEGVRVQKVTGLADDMDSWDAALSEDVDLAKTFAIGSYRYNTSNSANYAAECSVKLDIDAVDNVNMQRVDQQFGPYSLLRYVVYVIEDIQGDLFDVQTISGNAYKTDLNITIDEVDLSKTWLVCSCTSNNRGAPNQGRYQTAFSDSTTVLKNVYGSNYYSIDFNDFIVSFTDGTTVQHTAVAVTKTSAGLGTGNVALGTPVDLSRSIAGPPEVFNSPFMTAYTTAAFISNGQNRTYFDEDGEAVNCETYIVQANNVAWPGIEVVEFSDAMPTEE